MKKKLNIKIWSGTEWLSAILETNTDLVKDTQTGSTLSKSLENINTKFSELKEEQSELEKKQGDTLTELREYEMYVTDTLEVPLNLLRTELENMGLYTFVPELPLPGESNKIYLISTEDPNVYQSYIWLNDQWVDRGEIALQTDPNKFLISYKPDNQFIKYVTAKDFNNNQVPLAVTVYPAASAVVQRDIYGDIYVSNTDEPRGSNVVPSYNWVDKTYVRKTDFKSQYGLGQNAAANSVYIITALQDDIDNKQNPYKPITPKHLDYAVKVGVTTNTIALSDTEKSDACEWLGAANKKYVDEALANAGGAGGAGGKLYLHSINIMAQDGSVFYVKVYSTKDTAFSTTNDLTNAGVGGYMPCTRLVVNSGAQSSEYRFSAIIQIPYSNLIVATTPEGYANTYNVKSISDTVKEI